MSPGSQATSPAPAGLSVPRTHARSASSGPLLQALARLLALLDPACRLNNADLPRLRELLRLVTDEQYRRLLQNVLQYSKAFAWHAEKGGQAFEYTILSLRRRYESLKALLY